MGQVLVLPETPGYPPGNDLTPNAQPAIIHLFSHLPFQNTLTDKDLSPSLR